MLFGVGESHAQTFTNGDLNGSVNFVSVPTGWTQIPETDPICQANTPPEATVDILDATGPNQVGGVAGIPQSGNTFCSGLHSSDNGAFLWHEGLMQTVNGFTIGTQYSINFHQTIVKQQNAIDGSGSWRVYVDGNLIATTAVSTSNLAFDDVNLIWDCRVVTFTATANTHTIKFIPWDDDANLTNSPADATGGLRMGIDNIAFVVPADPTITPVGPFCVNEPPINLTAVDPGGQWTGPGITDAILGTFDPATAGIGNHDIIYTIPIGCGFEDDTITISIVNGVNAGWTDPGPMCANDPMIDLDLLVTGDPGGVWSGNGVVGNMFDPSVGSSAITYSVGVAPCNEDSTINIFVNALDDASFSYSQSTFCLLDANPTANITGLIGGTFTIDNGGVIDPSTGEVDLNNSGVGTFTITYTTNGPCPNTEIFILNVGNADDTSIDPAGPVCENGLVILMNAATAGGEWSATCGACIDANTGIFGPAIAGPGTHTITYTIQGQCGGTSTTNIVVDPVAQAAFQCSASEVSSSDPTISFTNQSLNATDYSWDFGDGVTSTDENTSHLFNQGQGEYQVCLTAMNTQNCNATTCKTVSIQDEFILYVPNTFTPNGDGTNDVFRPVLTGFQDDYYELLIFDRWGQVIFESNSISYNWDGTDPSGVQAKMDVYVWKIKVRATGSYADEEFVGHVTIVR